MGDIGWTNIKMAERVGFEPTIPLTVYKLSKRVPRTLRYNTNIYLTTKLQKLILIESTYSRETLNNLADHFN